MTPEDCEKHGIQIPRSEPPPGEPLTGSIQEPLSDIEDKPEETESNEGEIKPLA
jgi:hypothetical protein